MDDLFRLALTSLLVGFVAIRASYRRTWRPEERAERHLTREKWLTTGITLSMALPSLAWVLGDTLKMAAVDLSDPARLVGLPIGLAGLVLLRQTHSALGANFSPRLDLRTDHTLTRTGPYRYVRHPMYSSGFLIVIGMALLSANVVVAVLPMLMLVTLVLVRVPDEEAMLLDRFGPAYDSYARKTGRIIPRLRKSR